MDIRARLTSTERAGCSFFSPVIHRGQPLATHHLLLRVFLPCYLAVEEVRQDANQDPDDGKSPQRLVLNFVDTVLLHVVPSLSDSSDDIQREMVHHVR